MKKLYISDIFKMPFEDVINTKIVLNMHAGDTGESFIQSWYDSNVDIDKRYVGFSYWSHFGNMKNFKPGQIVLGFIRIPGKNKYLFITAGKIVSVPDSPSPCEFEKIPDFEPYIGRLIVTVHKGNTFGRYVFNLKPFWENRQIEVLEILRDEFRQLEFTGYENVHLKFHELLQILDSERYVAYKAHLAAVKGVYCLTDTSCGKLYIGSAYGVDGIAQRWNCYLDTKTGNNKKLIQLFSEKGEDYFKTNFTFTLLECFDKKTSNDIIISRESYWKNVLKTREFGYNDN